MPGDTEPGYEAGTRHIHTSRRPIAAAIAASVVVLGAAVAGATLVPRAPAAATPVPATRIPAALVSCNGMPDAECQAAVDVARAAAGELPAAVERAQAWPTLICRDDLDCPRPLLKSSRPVGSVVLTLADRGVVWVNVFSVPEPTGLDEHRDVLAGRVVRWLRDDA